MKGPVQLRQTQIFPQSNTKYEQECVPVGCMPPAH